MKDPILVLLPNNPGDVVMGLFVCAVLKEKYPDHPLHYIADEECRTLPECCPGIDKVWVLPRKSLRRKWEEEPASAWQFLLDFAEPLEHTRFYLSLNLFQDELGAYLQFLIQAENKSGMNWSSKGQLIVENPWAQYLFAIPANRNFNGFHVVDIYLRMAGIFDYRCIQPGFKNTPLPFNLPETPFIAVQAGSAWTGKRWPENRWKEFLEYFCARDNRTLVLLGAPQEAGLNLQLETYSGGRALNLCGKTNLSQIVQILKQADWLITGDTFAMHAAAWAGCKTLALFGASNPFETGPYQPKRSWIIYNGSSLPENLPLADPNPNLTELPGALPAQFLLGVLPPNAGIWEACFNPDLKRLELRHLNSGKTHLSAEYSSDVHSCDTSAQCHPLILNQLNNLECFSKGGTPQELRTLAERIESLEAEMANASHDSLRAERYRIALNAIPGGDYKRLIQERQRLLKEWAADCGIII